MGTCFFSINFLSVSIVDSASVVKLHLIVDNRGVLYFSYSEQSNPVTITSLGTAYPCSCNFSHTVIAITSLQHMNASGSFIPDAKKVSMHFAVGSFQNCPYINRFESNFMPCFFSACLNAATRNSENSSSFIPAIKLSVLQLCFSMIWSIKCSKAVVLSNRML